MHASMQERMNECHGHMCADACQLSPARLPAGITVAASDKTDTRWANSNYGSCVDLYGPGVAVMSAMDTSDTATMTASGTSMACPHVSGVAALYLQSNPTAQPNEVSTCCHYSTSAAWYSRNCCGYSMLISLLCMCVIMYVLFYMSVSCL